MSRVMDDLRAYLRQDGVVREALRRGIVNQRALARWLLERNGWEATEEAVLSALRRALAEVETSPLERAEAIFARAHLNMRSHVGIIKLSKTSEVQRLLPKLFDVVDYTKGEALRIIQSERSVKILLDEVNMPHVLRLLRNEHVEETTRRVTEINVVLPMESKTTPGIGALMMNALALQGINILEFVTGIPEVLLFVAEDDALAAYEALANLIQGADASGRKAGPARASKRAGKTRLIEAPRVLLP